MLNNQQQLIRAQVAACVAQAEHKLGIKLPEINIRFDLTGRAAGMAGKRYGTFYLRFNTAHMAMGGNTWLHLLNNTVPHEVAHTVCQAFPQYGSNHDAGWKRVCVMLGGNGQRCYSAEDAPEAVAQLRPWVYMTTLGHQVRVTKIIHTKIQRGTSYLTKGNRGGLNRQCSYNYMTAPAVVQSLAPTVRTAAPTVRTTVACAPAISNAARIRARIALAKSCGQGQQVVVEWSIAVLGQSASLARSYVNNNWLKA